MNKTLKRKQVELFNSMMVKYCLLAVFMICYADLAFAQAPGIQWQNTIGGTSHDFLQFVQTTSDGGYILGGYSSSNIGGDKTENRVGSDDYWVVKLDSNGIVQWDNTIGGSVQDYLMAVSTTSDGGYILGGYTWSSISGDKTENSLGSYDYWVVKLDSAGMVLWDNTIGGNYADVLRSIQQTSDGGYIIGGYSTSNTSSDKTENSLGGEDYWIVKLNSFGVVQWDNTIGGNNKDFLTSVQQTTDGGYFVSGYSASNISGNKSENCFGSYDYWVVKLDSFGVVQWDNTIGGSYGDKTCFGQQTSDGGYILGGYSTSDISSDKTENSIGGEDYWIVKLNSSGVIQWDNTIGGNNKDFLGSVQQTSDGGYVLGGYSNSNISGDKTENSLGSHDNWLVKVNSFGVVQWDKTIGGNYSDVCLSVQQASDGGYLLGSYSESGISGDKTEANIGGRDYWVVKLEGSIPEVNILGQGNSIANGDASPSATDDTEFGSANIGAGAISHTFTIENTGTGDLTLSGVPLVSITGSTDFSVTTQPASPVAAGGGTTTFTIEFSPTCDAGLKTAIVSIDNDDPDENPYTFTIQGTAVDTIKPAVSCPTDTTVQAGPASCSKTVNFVGPNASDNCNPAPSVLQTAGLSSGSAFPVGTTTNTFEATDGGGNQSTCTFLVTVQDTTDPAISSCPSGIVQANTNGACDAAVTWTAPGASDACGIDSLVGNFSPGTSFPVGPTLVRYVAYDAAFNTDTCEFTITVNDTARPSVTCPANVIADNNNANCDKVITSIGALASDNCAVSSSTYSFAGSTTGSGSGDASGSNFNVGITTVEYLAIDLSGNRDSCFFTVTVNDTTRPTITCPANVAVDNIPANCDQMVAAINPAVGDNCQIQDTSWTFTGATSGSGTGDASGSTFSAGVTTVTYTVQDSSGNINSCNFTITVSDTSRPSVVCPVDTVLSTSSGSCDQIVNALIPVAGDNCQLQDTTWNLSGATAGSGTGDVSGTTFGQGMTTLTYVVQDTSGNSNNCSFTVTINDSISPAASCMDTTIYVSAAGSVIINENYINNGSADNCGIATMVVSPDSFSCAETGLNVVTLTITDNAGNASACNANVTVMDTLKPNVQCQPITIYLDNTGNKQIAAADIDNGSSDACAIDSLWLNRNTFTCADTGTVMVTLTAADGSGNTDSCTVAVTVLDTIPPMAACTNDTVYLNAMGNATISASQVNGGSTDNCSVATITVSPDSFTAANLGPNAVTLTVTDVHGNVSFCQATVTVKDSLTGMEEELTAEQGYEIELYPNPTKGDLNLRISCGNCSKEEMEITVVNLQGQVLLKENAVLENGINESNLRLGAYAKGMYLVKLKSGEKIRIFKVLRE